MLKYSLSSVLLYLSVDIQQLFWNTEHTDLPTSDKSSKTTLHSKKWQRNWVFAKNSNLLIPISLQPDAANLLYFKLILPISIISLKYLRFTTLGYKDIEIRKSEFVAKTQFLFIQQNLLEHWSQNQLCCIIRQFFFGM